MLMRLYEFLKSLVRFRFHIYGSGFSTFSNTQRNYIYVGIYAFSFHRYLKNNYRERIRLKDQENVCGSYHLAFTQENVIWRENEHTYLRCGNKFDDGPGRQSNSY